MTYRPCEDYLYEQFRGLNDDKKKEVSIDGNRNGSESEERPYLLSM